MNSWSKAMITYSIASDLVQDGLNEDGEPVIVEVFYVLAGDERGNRWRSQPLDHANWQPTFPEYGSEAYATSGQEAMDIDAERTGRPYYHS